tara:strand:- start:466 stop:876 length:411 start_codon:yes stop_codon:yes gene_type:complete
MDDTYYALIKLTTGEEIISEIFTDDNEEDPIIALGSPVTVEITPRSNHNVLKFEPWVKVSFEETLFIRLSNVITMTELPETNYYVQCYQEYVRAGFQDITQQTGKGVKLNRTMGSLGTVDDARKILEKCLRLKLDT